MKTITLKKFRHAEYLSEETNAFSAEVYVDGKRAGYAKNDGHGGSTFIHSFEGTRQLLEEAEAYAKTLPDIIYPEPHSFTLKMNLEHLVDQLVEAELQKKEDKKMERTFAKAICWGVPKSHSYQRVTFRVPLSALTLAQLQKAVDEYKSEFKEGEVFLNTNLEALGVKI